MVGAVVFGGKSDQLFAELLGMFAFDDVFNDGNDGIFGQSGAEKNGAVVFGKAFVANPALEQGKIEIASKTTKMQAKDLKTKTTVA